MNTPVPRKPAPTSSAAGLSLVSLLVSGLLAASIALGVSWVVGGRGGAGGDERLGRIEEQLAQLRETARPGPPMFVADPTTADGKASASEAIAVLSRELADLRGRLGEGGGGESFVELARATDPGARRRAIRMLRDRAATDPEARRQLSQFFSDPDARVRREALDSVTKLGDPQALAEVTGLLGDQDPGLRGRAARSLGELAQRSQTAADKSRAAQSLQALLADGDSKVRREAVGALRGIGGREVMPSLVKALQDKSFEVQEQAVEALGQAGDPSAVAVLRQAYGDGSGPNALETAVAMKQLGDGSAFQKEAERLRSVLQQAGDPDERREALHLLVQNSPQEGRALIERALRDPSESMRREAQQLLDEQGRR